MTPTNPAWMPVVLMWTALTATCLHPVLFGVLCLRYKKGYIKLVTGAGVGCGCLDSTEKQGGKRRIPLYFEGSRTFGSGQVLLSSKSDRASFCWWQVLGGVCFFPCVGQFPPSILVWVNLFCGKTSSFFSSFFFIHFLFVHSTVIHHSRIT